LVLVLFVLVVFFLMLRLPPISTLFPYTTLFRSCRCDTPKRSEPQDGTPSVASRPTPLLPDSFSFPGSISSTKEPRWVLCEGSPLLDSELECSPEDRPKELLARRVSGLGAPGASAWLTDLNRPRRCRCHQRGQPRGWQPAKRRRCAQRPRFVPERPHRSERVDRCGHRLRSPPRPRRKPALRAPRGRARARSDRHLGSDLVRGEARPRLRAPTESPRDSAPVSSAPTSSPRADAPLGRRLRRTSFDRPSAR